MGRYDEGNRKLENTSTGEKWYVAREATSTSWTLFHYKPLDAEDAAGMRRMGFSEDEVREAGLGIESHGQEQSVMKTLRDRAAFYRARS
jgi:hypothetical protein